MGNWWEPRRQLRSSPRMNIAVIGWGSLLWDKERGELRLRSPRWRKAGPRLPLEFARKSTDGRLTLVIHRPSALQRAYWSLSQLESIDAAREDLATREGPTPLKNIHWATREGRGDPADDVRRRVLEWLSEHANVDAAIWTGLPPKDLDGSDVVAAAIAYLTGLDDGTATFRKAKKYVACAPPQIQTAVRRAMQQRGWCDEDLPAATFDASGIG